MSRAKIIACTIYKGGTVKTTTAVNLAGALAYWEQLPPAQRDFDRAKADYMRLYP